MVADEPGAVDQVTSSFVTTSGVLPADEYPQFESRASARWAKPGGPFDPHTGSQYVYSQIADVSYKRLTREIAVPPGGGDLTFWTSYDTEEHWDFLAVEARTAGGSDWTTLPDTSERRTRPRTRAIAARSGLVDTAPAPRPLPDAQRRRRRARPAALRRPVARRLG